MSFFSLILPFKKKKKLIHLLRKHTHLNWFCSMSVRSRQPNSVSLLFINSYDITTELRALVKESCDSACSFTECLCIEVYQSTDTQLGVGQNKDTFQQTLNIWKNKQQLIFKHSSIIFPTDCKKRHPTVKLRCQSFSRETQQHTHSASDSPPTVSRSFSWMARQAHSSY